MDEYFTQTADYAFGGDIETGFTDPQPGGLMDFADPVADSGLFPGDPLQELSTQYFAGGEVYPGFDDPQPGGLLDFAEMGNESVSFDYTFGGEIATGMESPTDLDILGVGLPMFEDGSASIPVTQPSAGTPTTWVADLTQLAMAAIKLNAAFQASQQPPVRTVTVAPSGVTTTPNANGTVTVRNPATGQFQVTRPAAGVPYALADGRTIINNGDGTYSMITADGRTTRTPYAPITQAGAGVPPALLWGGLALGAFLLMR